jgi:hypothetical protein
MPPHKHARPPTLSSKESEKRHLTRGEKILILLGALTLVSATLVVPEFREFLGLKPERPPVVISVPRPPANMEEKEPITPEEQKPVNPKFEVIPMPEKNVHIDETKGLRCISEQR